MSLPSSTLFDVALEALGGVGDGGLGEWKEIGDKAVHIRRRVSDRERASIGGLDVVDVRGTPEATRRIDRIRPFVPIAMRQAKTAEFP